MFLVRVVRCTLFVSGVSLLILAAGCGGSSSNSVSGKITLNGKAPNLAGLEINFLGSSREIISASISEDGTYKATGVPEGEVKVGFLYVPPADPNAPKGRRMPKPVKEGENKPPPTQRKNPIPEDMQDASTSRVTFTVVGGKPNTFDYDIKP